MIVAKVQSSESSKERVKRAFLRLMRGYGFYRPQVQRSLRISLRPEKSKIIDWDAQTWLSYEHPEHGRIGRMILLLGAFGLQDVARAFFVALTSEPKRITSKVSATSRSQWEAAMVRDIPEFLAEDSSENSDTTEGSGLTSLFEERDENAQGEPLSIEQQHLLERLIKEGTKKFAGRKRNRDEEAGEDIEPPSKRRKSDRGKPFPCSLVCNPKRC